MDCSLIYIRHRRFFLSNRNIDAIEYGRKKISLLSVKTKSFQFQPLFFLSIMLSDREIDRWRDCFCWFHLTWLVLPPNCLLVFYRVEQVSLYVYIASGFSIFNDFFCFFIENLRCFCWFLFRFGVRCISSCVWLCRFDIFFIHHGCFTEKSWSSLHLWGNLSICTLGNLVIFTI